MDLASWLPRNHSLSLRVQCWAEEEETHQHMYSIYSIYSNLHLNLHLHYEFIVHTIVHAGGQA